MSNGSIPPPLPPPRGSRDHYTKLQQESTVNVIDEYVTVADHSYSDDNEYDDFDPGVLANTRPPMLPPPLFPHNVSQHLPVNDSKTVPPPLPIKRPLKSSSHSKEKNESPTKTSKFSMFKALTKSQSVNEKVRPKSAVIEKFKRGSSQSDQSSTTSPPPTLTSPRTYRPPPPVPFEETPVSIHQPLPPAMLPPVRPSVPPPPPPSSVPPPVINNDSDSDDDNMNYEDVDFSHDIEPHPSDGIPFLQFINKQQTQFPIAFEVTLGFSARSEEASISEGERFIANFIKRSKVYTIEDENKEHYSVPLNTTFQFALLYDPNLNKKEAMSGFIFKTAGDLMITRSLPKVVRARKSFRGVSPESSVIMNELLFVKEVVQRESDRRYVKCIQAQTGKEKQLHEECAGEFSTLPHDVREYLPNLLKHFQLPLRAVMCLGIDTEEDIPSQLISAVVTISNPRIEESVVAASITSDSENPEDIIPENSAIILNDIPLTYDINLLPLQVTPFIDEKMLEQTRFIYENFNPAKSFPYMANSSSSQLALMKSIRKESNMHGVEIIEPKRLKAARQECAKIDSTSADSLAEVTKISGRMSSLESSFNTLEKKFDELSRKVKVDAKSDTGTSSQDIQFLKQEYGNIKKKMVQLDSAVKSLSDKFEGKL